MDLNYNDLKHLQVLVAKEWKNRTDKNETSMMFYYEGLQQTLKNMMEKIISSNLSPKTK